MGIILDQKKFSRRKRAFSGWTLLFAMVWAVHIWAYFYQKLVFNCYLLMLVILKSISSSGTIHEHLCHRTRPSSASTAMDMLLKSGFTSFAVFWMPCGRSPLTGSWAPCPTIRRNLLTLLDYVSGIVVLLFMRLTRGLDKSIQSAGAAGVWRADGVKLPWVTASCMIVSLNSSDSMQFHEHIHFYLGVARRRPGFRSSHDLH